MNYKKYGIGERESKFRLWCKEDERLYDVNSIFLPLGSPSEKDITVVGDNSWHSKLDGDVLMQYTGLKDKNGVEIYEGDIINANKGYWNKNGELGVVVFNKTRGGFLLKVNRRTSNNFNSLKINGLSGKEIIGNIFENPELLNNNTK